MQKEATSFVCKNCRMNVIMEDVDQDGEEAEELEDSLLIEDLNGEAQSDPDAPRQSSGAADNEGGVRLSKELRMSKEFKIGAADQYKRMKVCLDQQVEKTKQAENLLALNL